MFGWWESDTCRGSTGVALPAAVSGDGAGHLSARIFAGLSRHPTRKGRRRKMRAVQHDRRCVTHPLATRKVVDLARAARLTPRPAPQALHRPRASSAARVTCCARRSSRPSVLSRVSGSSGSRATACGDVGRARRGDCAVSGEIGVVMLEYVECDVGILQLSHAQAGRRRRGAAQPLRRRVCDTLVLVASSDGLWGLKASPKALAFRGSDQYGRNLCSDCGDSRFCRQIVALSVCETHRSRSHSLQNRKLAQNGYLERGLIAARLRSAPAARLRRAARAARAIFSFFFSVLPTRKNCPFSP